MQRYFCTGVGTMKDGVYTEDHSRAFSSNAHDHTYYLASEVDTRIAELEQALQGARGGWAAWKDVATMREHLLNQIRRELDSTQCRHPVLLDSPEQPGVDIYVCHRCNAEVRINESVIRRAVRNELQHAFPERYESGVRVVR